MRRTLLLVILALAAAVSLHSCGKKSEPPPTAPDPQPSCALSTTTLTFGTVAVGSSADRSFALSNNGGGTLSGTVTESSAEFALIGPTSYALSSGQTASFTLRYSPTSAGAKACTLATGAASCSAVIASGSGQTVAPVCEVSPTSLAFGAVNYATSTTRVVTVRNTGGGTLAGAVSVAPDWFYSILGDPTFSLGAGGVASFFVDFHPSTGGALACTVRVSPGGCTPVTGSGFGVLPLYGNCALRVTSGDTLDFGEVAIGSSAERFVTIQNTSSSYQSVGGGGEVCPDFEGNFSGNFLPGGSGQRSVRFIPTRPGEQYCAVELACSMTGSGTNGGASDYLILRGVGAGGAPTCQVSTTNLFVGTLQAGQSKDTTFTLTNTGTGPMSGSIHFVDPVPAPFSIVGTAAYSLGVGQSQVFTLRYVAPSVPAGHTISDARQLDLGSSCATLGFLTVQGTAIP